MKAIVAVALYWIFCLSYTLWLSRSETYVIDGRLVRVEKMIGHWFQVRARWLRRVFHLMEAQYGFKK